MVDAHLDIAYNALQGRNVLLPAREQAVLEYGSATVGIPDLRAGNATLICPTIYCEPSFNGSPGYRNAIEANLAGRRQLDWYMSHRNSGIFRLITRSQDVPVGVKAGESLAAIILLEGADPILSPDDAQWWFDAGVRIVGLAWKQTRYAGGTGMPGPLSADGRELAQILDQMGIIHDASHLAEESFWELLDITTGPVIASHSNCRAIIPTDRQLSDEMIRAIAKRGGVIGINFFDRFLVPAEELTHRRAHFSDVIRHIRHIADLLGGDSQIGLGTDMDGGLGRENVPDEIASWADLPRLGDALSAAEFADRQIAGILGDNWLAFFRRSLPGNGT